MDIKNVCEKMGFPVKFGEQTEQFRLNDEMIKVEKYDGTEYFVFTYTEDEIKRMDLKIKDADFSKGMFLIDIEIPNKNTRYYNDGSASFLMGKDNKCLFFTRIEESIETVKQALDLLEPRLVKIANSKGKNVIRQGDWFFIPGKSPVEEKIIRKLHLSRKHIADEGIIFKAPKVKRIYVRGNISHSQHETIYLSDWHRAVQNQTKFYKRITKMLTNVKID